MSAQTIVYCIHGLFALALLLALVWAITRPNPRDDYLIDDFLYLERRKRVTDRRAKRRSPESNGRRKGDQ